MSNPTTDLTARLIAAGITTYEQVDPITVLIPATNGDTAYEVQDSYSGKPAINNRRWLLLGTTGGVESPIWNDSEDEDDQEEGLLTVNEVVDTIRDTEASDA